MLSNGPGDGQMDYGAVFCHIRMPGIEVFFKELREETLKNIIV